jgi:2-hydroxychromene-2-carboxylate isomerase
MHCSYGPATMKAVTFWFDPVSPFAYLAFERLPQVLEGCSYAVEYRPVLFAGLLTHWGQKGPAEIEPKRAWTFRQVAWLAHQHGVTLELPAVHPFNPLPLLRLALACGPNRRIVEALMRHVWTSGADAADPARLAALAQRLAPARDPASVEVKNQLRAATDLAITRGVFGVPTFELDGRLFWGVDALPMLRAALRGEAWFDGPAWDAASQARPGVAR